MVTSWKLQLPPGTVRTRSHNIVIHLPGVKGVAKGAKTALQRFKLFFPDKLIAIVVENTNQ